MKISLEWISDYVDLPVGLTAEQIAHDLTLKTVEVEDVIPATIHGHEEPVIEDHILEIDNKSLTNRPDLWGHYGIARELAVIYGVPLNALEFAPVPGSVAGLIERVDRELCQRFTAVELVVLDPEAATPQWMRDRLTRIGEAPVNLLVDLSNYVMFTTGQPTHVYDADTIALPLSVYANDATSQTELLSGPANLYAGTPMVADANGPVAVAGVMGAAASAVASTSRRFVLEAATFRPQPIRRASQRLGIRSEASARFEKGLNTQRVDEAIGFMLRLLETIVPTAKALGMQNVEIDPTTPTVIDVDADFLASRIGTRLPDDEVQKTLQSLGYVVSHDGDHLHITTPTWRSTGDVSLPHDIVEEVARIHGYDNLPVEPLTVALNSVRSLHQHGIDRRLREQLAIRCGMQEVVTYPWTADGMLAATGWDKTTLVHFDGAPAPDRDTLRPSLIPNLLEAVVSNLRYAASFSLFEVGTVFPGGKEVPYLGDFEDMPPQAKRLAGVLVGSDGIDLFRRAKGILESVRRHAHIVDFGFTAGNGAAWADHATSLTIIANRAPAGTLALLSKRVRRLTEITADQVACFELDLDLLLAHSSRHNQYSKISELPDADFDLSIVVADDVPWSTISEAASNATTLVNSIDYVSEFRGAWVPAGHRSLTFRTRLRPRGETLTAEMINTARSAILNTLANQTGARLRED